MIQLGDTVLYGSEGVCTVAEITELDFGGKPARYYLLKPVYNPNSAVYVPVENEKLTAKMRRVLSVEEIRAVVHAIPREESLWIEDEEERKAVYRDILQRGDRLELARIIKALYFHEQEQRAKGKHLHAADERFFKEAEKMLYHEFALVLNISPDEVVPFLFQQIEPKEK